MITYKTARGYFFLLLRKHDFGARALCYHFMANLRCLLNNHVNVHPASFHFRDVRVAECMGPCCWITKHLYQIKHNTAAGRIQGSLRPQ